MSGICLPPAYADGRYLSDICDKIIDHLGNFKTIKILQKSNLKLSR